MFKKYLHLIGTICSLQLYGQNEFKYPNFKNEFYQINEITPKDWFIVDSLNFDINNDNQLDKIIIFRYRNNLSENQQIINYKGEIESHEMAFNPKIILVALNYNNRFKIINKFTRWILANDFGIGVSDPFIGIIFKKNIFTLQYLTGGTLRTSLSYKFRFQNNKFVLIGATSITFQSSKSSNFIVDLNCLTGKGIVNNKDITFKSIPPITLDEFQPYSNVDPLSNFDLGN